MKRFLLIVVLLPAVACASASGKTKPSDRPALAVPAPPPRIVESTSAPEPTSDAAETPQTPSANPAGARPPVRPPTAREVSPKLPATEGRSEAQAEPPSTPPPQLRTTESGGAEKTARATIDRARQILNTVNFGPLSNERKKAYNDVKKFADQADDALKRGNVVLAQSRAAKAETLAKELAGR